MENQKHFDNRASERLNYCPLAEGCNWRTFNEVGDIMKPFLCLMSLLLLGLGGCLEPPGYSTKQRFDQIGNSMGYDLQMVNDDIDHTLLLRPSSHLTDWNVLHTY